jgi:hypothetical protein
MESTTVTTHIVNQDLNYDDNSVNRRIACENADLCLLEKNAVVGFEPQFNSKNSRFFAGIEMKRDWRMLFSCMR